MKKIFTFFLAMVMISMAFAQNGKYTVHGVNNVAQERSNWYGWFTTSGYVHVQAAESEYILYCPANTIANDYDIEQVRFYAIPSENINDYTGTAFQLGVFTIRIYANPTVNGHEITLGTPVYTQTYDASEAEAGAQVVALTTAYHVAAGNSVAIGIYCEDMSAMGLCDHDPACAPVNFAYWPDFGDGYHHYYWTASNPAWAYENAPVQEHDPWILSFYYNDGQQYSAICDWHSEIYDPEDGEQYPDAITWQYVDNYTDSIYFYGGAFNMGIDSSYGMYYESIYAQVEGGAPVYFLQDQPLKEEVDSYEPNYGFRHGPIGLMGVDEMENEGLTFPFEMCLSLTYEPDASYPSSDPNLDNNTYCITVSNQQAPDDPDGINANDNTLTVSPNPASTVIRVDNAAGAQISIYNIAGQEVMTMEAANANETINVANLTEGVYVVRVVNGNEVATSKVSIIR
ncbi:MAG: T9SS type A sorting domain-containing protein [Bacteroidales bacterium]|nr:T9SS type A sorting domain-containing protein [Bacteroidales bacterium]